MTPHPTPKPDLRTSAVLAWVLLLLVSSLAALSQGSLRDGSFAAAAGLKDSAAVLHRVACVPNGEDTHANGDGSCWPVALAYLPTAIHSGRFPIVADGGFTIASHRCTAAQPRAPPYI